MGEGAMDRTRGKSPPGWVEDLTESEADVANGAWVPAEDIHRDIRDAADEMTKEQADQVSPRR